MQFLYIACLPAISLATSPPPPTQSNPTKPDIARQHAYEDDTSLVKKYVLSNYQKTFREPNGTLEHPYLVPGGPYDQSWDWDSVFTGLALLDLGSAPYLAGSMKNFFDQTNSTTGEVTICVDPTTTSPSCSSDPADNQASGSHAKPLLIQGALIAADFTGDYEQFHSYKNKMAALLKYWEDVRKVPNTGLYTWHDQMESGADNLVLSTCPSPRSGCWVDACANSLAAPDVMTFLYREHLAFAKFLDEWGEDGGDEEREKAESIAKAMNDVLWNEDDGFHHAHNVSSEYDIDFATYVLGFPLWAGEDAITKQRATAIVNRITSPDMLGEWGVRSTSSENEFYNNEDIITPYSNWQVREEVDEEGAKAERSDHVALEITTIHSNTARFARRGRFGLIRTLSLRTGCWIMGLTTRRLCWCSESWRL